MINMGELFGNNRICDIPMELVPLNESEKSKFGVEVNDLLFARQSIVAEGAGKCSIVAELGSEVVCFESHIIRVRLDDSIANPIYYYYFYQSDFGKALLASIRQQGVQAGIRGKDLETLSVPCPSIGLQRKIAMILSAYDELIENNHKRIKLLEEKARQAYEEWFVRMRFPDCDSTPTDPDTGFPQGWESRRLVDEFEVKYGKGLGKKDMVKGGRYCVYGASGVVGQHNVCTVETKTVLVGCRGTVGNVHRTFEPRAFVTNNSFTVVPVGRWASASFTQVFETVKRVPFKISKSGSAQPQITLKSLQGIQIICPTEELIAKWDSSFGLDLDEVDGLRKQIELLAEARDILLPRLMTGVIDVEELDVDVPMTA